METNKRKLTKDVRLFIARQGMQVFESPNEYIEWVLEESYLQKAITAISILGGKVGNRIYASDYLLIIGNEEKIFINVDEDIRELGYRGHVFVDEEALTGIKYKSEEQLYFLESLCDNTFRFYHEVGECYPEIEVYIKNSIPCEDLISLCERELETKGFAATNKVQVSSRFDEYNELVFTIDLRIFDNEELKYLLETLRLLLVDYATSEEQTIRQSQS